MTQECEEHLWELTHDGEKFICLICGKNGSKPLAIPASHAHTVHTGMVPEQECEMAFKIEKGIPVPTDLISGGKGGVTDTLRSMVVGDSVLDPETNEEKVKPRWYSAASRMKRTIVMRRAIDSKTKKHVGFRIWLTAINEDKPK